MKHENFAQTKFFINVMFNCFISGEGVFADTTFEKGDFLLEYRGEYILYK